MMSRFSDVRENFYNWDEREREGQEQTYAVSSMVCAAVCSGLESAPCGSVWVVVRLRVPSVDPTLEAE